MTNTTFAPAKPVQVVKKQPKPDQAAREVEIEAQLNADPNSVTGVKALLSMLTFRRPAGSKTERKFIDRFLRPLGVDTDKQGNLILRIGNARTMWSCHTDTVHKMGGRQLIALRGTSTLVLANREKESNCLGADDTAGVWLMREMILAKKPGLYVFHRAEEIGGIGSTYIAENSEAMLDTVDHAIAFDRRGTTSVITHQGWGRCCSQDFAFALCKELGETFRPDENGIFTDTANYVDHIPECTNISVGYDDEHTARESLDCRFLLDLRERVMGINLDRLPVLRDPNEPDFDDQRWLDYRYSNRKTYTQKAWDHFADDQEPRYGSILALVRDYPEEIADILEQHGYDAAGLQQEIDDVHYYSQQ